MKKYTDFRWARSWMTVCRRSFLKIVHNYTFIHLSGVCADVLLDGAPHGHHAGVLAQRGREAAGSTGRAAPLVPCDGAGIQHGRITKMQTLRERLAQHFAELLPERDDA